jgi:hypothetical protein
MKTGSIFMLALSIGSISALWAQSQPSQPVDPTSQSPSTIAPATPPTPSGIKRSDEGVSNSETPSTGQTGRNFVGTIVKRRHEYVLKLANTEYLLDDHGEAKKYKGKLVMVTGTVDENHTIRVRMIALSPRK